MIWNWLRRHQLLVDVGTVTVLLALSLATAAHREEPAAAFVLAVIGTVPLLRRRDRPAEVVAVVTAAALATISLGYWLFPFQLAFALYTLPATGRASAARAVGAGSIAAMALALGVSGYARFGDAAARVVLLVAAWLLGDSIGSRRAYVREIEEKAERLERERQNEARRAVAEEQARIARELHDVVAHALSVIVVQAGAASEVFATDPIRARAPIRAIDAAARSALADLRRVLGVLQEGAEYEPQPGLSRLDQLVENVRATGLDVALEIVGAPRPLPAAVDLSAYRIVQEALTNTLKHAHAQHVDVRVRYGDRLELDVRDDGRGSVNGYGGNGIVGMRERVALLGGTIETGTGPGGGFRVLASIPLDPVA
jgi:signal transduction histidine kinase